MAGALEKRWFPAVQSFTGDGNANGIVPVADSFGFYTGMKVAISATGLETLYLNVKIVYSSTQISVGPPQHGIDARTDISTYTVAGGAKIAAGMQVKPQIQPPEIFNAVYEHDPVVAWRTKLVDKYGASYDAVTDINGLRRLAVDAAVTISGVTVDLDAFHKVPPDNVLVVGSEDGTETGVKHALEIDANLNAHVINMGALVPKIFDSIAITNSVISGQTVPTQVQYYTGGLSGTLQATLTLVYDGSANLLSVVRT